MKKIFCFIFLFCFVLLSASVVQAGSTSWFAQRNGLSQSTGNLFLQAQVPLSWMGDTFKVWYPFEADTATWQYNYAIPLVTNDGAISGMYVTNRYGFFDGIDDRILLTNHTDNTLQLNDSSFTIAGWVYVTNASDGAECFFCGPVAAGKWPGVFIDTESSGDFHWTAYLSLDGLSPIYLRSGPYLVNVWTHLALVRNGGTITFYTNGLGVASANLGTSALYTNTGFSVGSYLNTPSSWANPLHGRIDDLIVDIGTALWTTTFTPPPRTNTKP